MPQNRCLRVAVHQLGPSEFSWTLVRQQDSTGLAECIAASSASYADFEQALDAGFVALGALCS